MQKDFHYCLIKVLANKAGFSEEESQIIGYASQYVDDAVEHKPIKIDGIPSHILQGLPKNKEGLFNPVCTAHRLIQDILSMLNDIQRENTQRKIYIPFHFIPPEIYSGKGDYIFRTFSNGKLALNLVKDSIIQLKSTKNSEERIQKLIKLGISLHSYADTWSHEGFSGRLNKKDNNVGKIKVRICGKSVSGLFINSKLSDLISSLGHGEAWNYPDMSHVEWECVKDDSGDGRPARNNAKFFLEASKAIFSLLCQANGKQDSNWREFEDKIWDCLSFNADEIGKKLEKYKTVFCDIKKFEYSDKEWRENSLEGSSVDFSSFDISTYLNNSYRFKGDLKWFYFHIEALKQRSFIMECIPKN